MDSVVSRLNSNGVPTKRLVEQQCEKRDEMDFEGYSAMIVDGACHIDVISNAIRQAAVDGIPRLLRIAETAKHLNWRELFQVLEQTPPFPWIGATVVTSDVARLLAMPTYDDWPPTPSVAQSLTWLCRSHWVCVEDMSKQSWYMMGRTGKLLRMPLPIRVNKKEVPEKILATMAANRAYYETWQVKRIPQQVYLWGKKILP